MIRLFLLLLLLSGLITPSNGFAPLVHHHSAARSIGPISSSSRRTGGSSSSTTVPPMVVVDSALSMVRVAELRRELDELRVDYSDCFDKESLLKRLEDAIEGRIPTMGGDASKEVASVPEPAVVGNDGDNNAGTTTQPNAGTAVTATNDNNEQSVAAASKQKEEAIVFDEAKVYEEVRGMKVKELREELARRRLRWADLLEKSDLVRAVVQARKAASTYSSHITPGTVADLTEEQVQDELQPRGAATTTPLLLDVYATWCGPCKMMAKELTGAATEWHDRVRLAKMDSDKYPRLASTFKVQGLPTIILFDANGQEVDRLEGALPKAQLMQWVETKLNSSSS